MTGQLALQYDLDAALERAGEAWASAARDVMGRPCRFDVAFSAEDVVEAVGLPPGITHNALGAIFKQAANEGWIVEAGSRRSSRPGRRGGLVRVWRGV